MRILWDIKELGHDGTYIEEISTIEIVPCWHKEDTGKIRPSHLEIQFDGEYVGCYEINTDEFMYNKAMEIIKKVMDKLLTKGYCKASEFYAIFY